MKTENSNQFTMSRRCRWLLTALCILVVFAQPFAAFAYRSPSYAGVCINNMRQLEGAREQWSLESKQPQNAIPNIGDLVGTDKYVKVLPQCLRGGSYSWVKGSNAVIVCSHYCPDINS